MNAIRIRAVIVDGELDQASAAILRDAMASPEATVVFAAPQVAQIIEHVSRLTDVPTAVIIGPSKARGATRARFAVCWVAARFGRAPSQIGRALDGRDWSVIRNAVDQASYFRERDQTFLTLTDRVMDHFMTGGLS